MTEFDTILPWLTYLEPILFSKLDDGPSSFSCCICSIKDLKQQENTLLMQPLFTLHVVILWSFSMENLSTAWRTHRHLSSFDTQVLPNIVKCCHRRLTVDRRQTQSQWSVNAALDTQRTTSTTGFAFWQTCCKNFNLNFWLCVCCTNCHIKCENNMRQLWINNGLYKL